jgi:DNA repair exonuclease SbcCD ATPase subunit
MSTLTDKLPTLKLPEVKLPDVKVIDLDEAKKPAFAAVGVVDMYVEQLKELPATAKKAQADITAKFEARRVANTEKLKAVPAQLKALPADAKKLRTEVEAKFSKAQTEATAYYAKLATRGEKLVGQIRRQPATEAAIAEGKAAVKKAEAASTSAKKAVKATEKAVEGAASKIG